MTDKSIYLLTPLAMRVPNRKGIYALSKLRKSKVISSDEFSYYTSVNMLVSHESDGISNPELVDAWGYRLDCWYLVDFIPSKELRERHKKEQND